MAQDEYTLLDETFDGYHREQDGGTFEASHWDVYNDRVVSSAGDDGALKTTLLDVTGQSSLNVKFDAMGWLSGHANFEGKGEHGEDSLVVKVIIDGQERILDTFYYDEHTGEFVGDTSGQTFGVYNFSSISYDDIDLGGASSAQVVFDSELTACNEFLKLDDILITGSSSVTGDDCLPTTMRVLSEDFAGIHDPEDSDSVAGHTDWTISNGKAFSTNHKEGALTFTEVDLNGHSAAELCFDIGVNCVANFETGGRWGDSIEVQIRMDSGHWVTIDTLERVPHSNIFRGDQSGQEFGDYGLTTLSYRTDDLPSDAESVQFRIVSDVSSTNEQIFVDNVKIDVEKVLCDKCVDKIDFEGLAKGATEAEINAMLDGVTITAMRNDNDGNDVVWEAEHMHERGFHTVHSSAASGGAFEKLNSRSDSGVLFDDFDGADGTYELSIRLQDESDGQSTVVVTIGDQVKTIVLDADSDGSGSNHGPFSTVSLGEFDIERHEEVKVEVFRDAHELGRIDKLIFDNVAPDTVGGDAMIFDTDHPTGGDHDLEAGDGKVLIISEDNDSSDPDDNASGGAMRFDFDNPATLSSIDVVDTEEGGVIEFFDENGAKIGEVDVPQIGNNTTTTVDLGGVEGVSSMLITLNGSGAVDNLCFDKGEPELAGLGDFVWFDEDRDGIQDADESGVDGVLVELKDADGNVIDTTTTANGGQYSFTGLIPGTYSVGFTAPEGFVFTQANAGSDDAADSDADTTTGMTQQVTLTGGEFNGTLDAGLIVENTPPEPVSNALAMLCVGLETQLGLDGLPLFDDLGALLEQERDPVILNLLAGAVDPDGDPLTITEISDDDETAGVGGSITTAEGVVVTLNANGTVSLDGTNAAPDLLINTSREDTFNYTLFDGSDGVTGTAEITLKGDLNTIETIGESLPEIASIDIDNTFGFFGNVIDSQVTIDFAGRDDIDGVYQGYCIELPDPVNLDPTDALVYSSYEDLPDRLTTDDIDLPNTLDNVNYLLNRDDIDTFSFNDVQQALRALVTTEQGTAGLSAASLELYNDALLDGDGFIPGVNDAVGIILEPIDASGNDNGQVYIVSVPFNVLAEDCFCL